MREGATALSYLLYSFCSCLGACTHPCTLVLFLIGTVNILFCLLIKKLWLSAMHNVLHHVLEPKKLSFLLELGYALPWMV